jgi:hypothetical protein
MAEQSTAKDEAKTPFTIITGFLGAGKTTLINYILTEQRDKRICVIENEFGEINIDEKLVSANMASKEDLIQMDNGCACCSIRGDLVRTLGGLVEKRQQFDAVMLETTGLADPAPIIATLKSNQWIDDNFAIDAVVCREGIKLQFLVCRGPLLSGHGRGRRSAVVAEFELDFHAGRLPGQCEARQGAPRGAEAGRFHAASLLVVAATARGRAREAPRRRDAVRVRATADTHTHTRNSLAAMAVGAALPPPPRRRCDAVQSAATAAHDEHRRRRERGRPASCFQRQDPTEQGGPRDTGRARSH